MAYGVLLRIERVGMTFYARSAGELKIAYVFTFVSAITRRWEKFGRTCAAIERIIPTGVVAFLFAGTR